MARRLDLRRHGCRAPILTLTLTPALALALALTVTLTHQVTETLYPVPLINHTKLSLRAERPLRSASGNSPPTTTEPMTLRGDFGSADRPRVAHFGVARRRRNLGLDNGPMVFSVSLHMPTNMSCSLCRLGLGLGLGLG